MNTEEQTPPNDPKSELLALAAAVERPELLGQMSADLFFAHADAFRFLAEHRREIESCPETWMRWHKLFRVNHRVALLLQSTGDEMHSAWNGEYWLETLEELRAARAALRLRADLSEAADALSRGEPFDLGHISRELDNAARRRGAAAFVDLKSAVRDLVGQLEQEHSDPESRYGLRTGIAPVDELLLGLHPGRLYIVAARPARGKTAFASQAAWHVAASGSPVFFSSLEMTPADIGRRIVQQLSGGNLDMRGAGERDFAAVARATVEAARARVLFSTSPTLGQIEQEAAEAVRGHGAKLVVVDYLQRVQLPGIEAKRVDIVGEISTRLKDLALRLSVPVLACAQLSRAHESERRLPTLADLRESGSIEADADVVLALHGETEASTARVVNVDCLVLKNRHGPIDRIRLSFDRPSTRFSATPPVEPSDLPRTERRRATAPCPDP
jgi:replicative DNA helicase